MIELLDRTGRGSVVEVVNQLDELVGEAFLALGKTSLEGVVIECCKDE